jgi:hypothetical protein
MHQNKHKHGTSHNNFDPEGFALSGLTAPLEKWPHIIIDYG